METMERDALYIAQQVKFIRKMHRLTQENLADAAGLSTRTIEKIESGRHRPDEQTLRSIARAVQMDVTFFEKPSPEQEAKQQADMERALRKNVLVATQPIRTASEFLAAFGQREAYRIDMSAITDDAALETAAAMGDWIRDMGDIWEECYMSHRLEYARGFANLCQQIEGLGYLCYMGNHKQQLRQKDRARMIFNVGVMTILPKEGATGTRYALIQLEGAWESMEEDRGPLA